MNSPLSSTRSRRAWVGMGSSPTSSRKMVPPSATSKYPLRSARAPVNDPFSCPNSSESIVPSGMAPQLTAMYVPCLRWLFWWMICGKFSLPTPLSPVISTERSVGATCMATSMARLSVASLPMIPKRCLTCCMDSSFISGVYILSVLPDKITTIPSNRSRSPLRRADRLRNAPRLARWQSCKLQKVPRLARRLPCKPRNEPRLALPNSLGG